MTHKTQFNVSISRDAQAIVRIIGHYEKKSNTQIVEEMILADKRAKEILSLLQGKSDEQPRQIKEKAPVRVAGDPFETFKIKSKSVKADSADDLVKRLYALAKVFGLPRSRQLAGFIGRCKQNYK